MFFIGLRGACAFDFQSTLFLAPPEEKNNREIGRGTGLPAFRLGCTQDLLHYMEGTPDRQISYFSYSST